MMKHKDWDINEEPKGFTDKGKPIIGATFQNGLNDIEPDGSFVPCDEGVSEVTQGVTHLKMNRGRMGELRFGDSNHPNSFLVKIKNKGLKGVSFKYIGAEGSSMTANNGKPLCNFDNGISIESTPYYKGVKMDIIVNDPLTAPLEYPFSVKTYGQDYTFIEENGGATLIGEDQDPIFIKPPYAIDANGDIGPVTIHYTGMDGTLITFKKVVDETWLRQAAAPVKIDPDVTIEDGVDGGVIKDTFGLATSPTSNFGAFTFLYILGTVRSSFIYVDIGTLGDITPVSGKFLCTAGGGSGGARTDKAYKLLVAFEELEATWNDRTTGVPWAVAGAKGVADRAATEESSFSPNITAGQVTEIPITVDTLTEWLTTNYGVVAEYFSGDTGSWFFGSSENTTDPIQFYMEYTEGGAQILRRRMEEY
jgi:hypothetical protein